jgi:hypothetical protein
MKGYTAGKAYRRSGVFPYVEIWEQPSWRLAIAKLYHFWENKSWPLMKRLEKFHTKWFEKDDFFIPLSNRQDIRCDDLMHKGRNTLAIVYVTDEQYEVITKKMPKPAEPRREATAPITHEEEPIWPEASPEPLVPPAG